MNCSAFSYSDRRCCKTPSFAAQSGLLTSQKGHLEGITAMSDISNQNQLKKDKNQARLSHHFSTHSGTLQKEEIQSLPLLTSATDDGETGYIFLSLYRREICKTIYIYAGVPSQKRQ